MTNEFGSKVPQNEVEKSELTRLAAELKGQVANLRDQLARSEELLARVEARLATNVVVGEIQQEEEPLAIIMEPTESDTVVTEIETSPEVKRYKTMAEILEAVENEEGDYEPDDRKLMPFSNMLKTNELLVFNTERRGREGYYAIQKNWKGWMVQSLKEFFDGIPDEFYNERPGENGGLFEIVELPYFEGVDLSGDFDSIRKNNNLRLVKKGNLRLTEAGQKQLEFKEELNAGPTYKTEEDLEASGITPSKIMGGILSWITPDKKWCLFTIEREEGRTLGPALFRNFEKQGCNLNDKLEDCKIIPAYIWIGGDKSMEEHFKDPYTDIAMYETITRGKMIKK